MKIKKCFQNSRYRGIPGHMVKAQNEIKDSLKLIDVVVEILDARVPMSSQNPLIDEMVKGKSRIVILNKCDLADETQTQKWIKHFKNMGITAIAVNSSNTFDIKNIIAEINRQGQIVYSKKDKNRSAKLEVKPIYRVLIIGIPNVGKSTIINRISKKNSLEVGNKPGVTTKKQWIRVDGNIDLLDTPGILWPDLSHEQIGVKLALTGNIKQEVLDIEELACAGIELLIQDDKYKEMLKLKYKLQENDLELISYDILEKIGAKRGCIVSGGVVDMNKASRCFLDDLMNGKIGKITFDILK